MADLSPLDRLRRRYQQLAGQPPETFDLPIERTAGGDLVAVYREAEWADVEEIKDRWGNRGDDPRDELYGYAELIAKSCVDILIRDDEHPAAVERKGLPGKYLPGMGLERGLVSYHAAATELGMPASDDDPLVAVFGVLASDWEVERHGKKVAKFEPRVPSPEVDATFMGESGADQPSAASPAGT